MEHTAKAYKRPQFVLLLSVFVVSVCGLAYELLLGSLATQLMGNPVLQYSLTIGIFMSALGLGSFLSRFIISDLLLRFIQLELLLGIFGGISVAGLRIIFISAREIYFLCHILGLILFGTLVGLEIPILTRLLKKYGSLRNTLSNVLSIDYIGGLLISIAYPLVLYPLVGSTKTALIIGLTNVVVGVFCLLYFRRDLSKANIATMSLVSIVSIIILVIGIFTSSAITGYFNHTFYQTKNVVLETRTPYQTLVLTRDKADTSLFIDGHLQFSSIDEYRYHEAMVHPLFFYEKELKNILVMGGGDGLAVRELLKFPQIEHITLVDLDPVMTELGQEHPMFLEVNKNSLNHPKVNIINDDAYHFMSLCSDQFDAIIADFPDPHDESIAKLYSREFYTFMKSRLRKNGLFITQATSPKHASDAYWCIHYTLKQVFEYVTPYHIPIRSLGDWGFQFATDRVINPKVPLFNPFNKDQRIWFDHERWISSQLFGWDEFIAEDEVALNTYEYPILYTYILRGWQYY